MAALTIRIGRSSHRMKFPPPFCSIFPVSMMNHLRLKKMFLTLAVFTIFTLTRLYFTRTPKSKKTYPLPLFIRNENLSVILHLDPIAISSKLCENPAENLTDGRWVGKTDFFHDTKLREYEELLKLEDQMDRHLRDFRIKRGVHTRLWRSDLKCGLKNLQDQPYGNRFGESAGSWCDAKGETPCFTDENGGICSPPSQEACDCPRCIDMRKILHAELSEWLPNDARCRRREYGAREACAVLQNFAEIHFVGDSFVRKMARAVVLTLRSDPIRGADIVYNNADLQSLCHGPNQFYWTECKLAGELGQIQEQMIDKSPLCNNPEVPIYLYTYFSLKFSEKFHSFIRNLSCKANSLVVIGVGGHMNCQAQVVIDIYFRPAVEYLKSACGDPQRGGAVTWPRVIFLYPDTIGLMKSPHYRKNQGRETCNKFADEMKKYCDENDITVLDFRKLTSGVHSYDGAHHGIGVNMMKTQLLLNYLDYFRRKPQPSSL